MCMRMHDEGQADGPCFIVIHINKYNAPSVIDHPSIQGLWGISMLLMHVL